MNPKSKNQKSSTFAFLLLSGSVFLCVCFLLSLVGAQTPLFRDATAEAGLQFHHFTGATGEYFMPEIMGSGCALFDYDGDGDLDVFLVQSTLLNPTKEMSAASFPPPSSWKPGHRLFRNELIPSGKLRFTDVTTQAGIGAISYGMGAAVGDIDGDGDLDLYVTCYGSNLLYRNNGRGTFTDITQEAGVDDPRWSTSAAFVDYDRDGDLDLYVANYVDFSVRGNKQCFSPAGELDYCSPAAYRPVPDRLFRNDGKGKFTDVSRETGIGAVAGPGLGVTCADFNGDGWPDIYVANDGAANLLWRNKGNGTFEEVGLLAGVAYGMDGIARAGMGATAGDFDNDGDEDILVTNLSREGSTLFQNDGRGNFRDASADFRIAQSSFLSTGFGVGWFDYDNDGKLDLFAANGAVTMMPALRGSRYPFHQRNQLFHSEDSELRDVTTLAGPAFQLSEVSRGTAFGDVDNDGDVDLLVSNNNGSARLLLNEVATSPRHHWLAIKLEGVKDNRHGIGALVTVLRKGQKPLWRYARTDGSYLSASSHDLHFGLGTSAATVDIGVKWLSGEKEIWQGVQPDKIITLRQQTGKPWK